MNYHIKKPCLRPQDNVNNQEWLKKSTGLRLNFLLRNWSVGINR
jgi:hypothetical protein